LLSWFGTGTSIKVEELNLEKTKRAFKNGQSRENQKDIQEWTIQRKPKGHSRMDNPEKTKRTFKNGQSRENQKDIQEWTIQVHWQHWAYKDTGQRKTKHNTTQN
jgi:hypothetical protein